MNERVKHLREEIRNLSPEERAELVDELILDYGEPDPEIEKAWVEEAERRIDALNRGETQAISARKIFTRHRGRNA
jgi:putative addiction module component (TIGR02574 family)